MTVQVYRATDSGAPVLRGQTASLFNVLYSCLVTGYASKVAAGWTNPYFDAQDNNVLRAGLPGKQFCLRFADQYAGHENFAVMSGFSSMSGLNAGNDSTPTVSQSLLGLGIRKSISADATVRDWIVVANQRFFYLFINPNSSVDFASGEGYCFGQFDSFRSGDEYNCIILGRSPLDFSTTDSSVMSGYSATNAALSYHYLMKSYTQAGVAITAGKHADTSKALLPFPNPVDGNLFVNPVFITESAQNCVRGKFPGLWHVCHNKSYFNHGDTFEGNGVLAGKSFLILKVYNGVFALEISDTWDV